MDPQPTSMSVDPRLSQISGYLSLIVCLLTGVPGCSAAIAALKADEPLWTGIVEGQSRQQVIEQIGSPERSITSAKHTLDIYVVEEDSTSHEEVETYIGVGAATYGLSELFTVPYALLADRHETIPYAFRYGSQGTLESIARGPEAEAAEKKFVTAAHLRQEATTGDRESASILAREFHDTNLLEDFARQGDPAAAFEVYLALASQPETTSRASQWLCEAANGADPQAQKKLGYWHRTFIWEYYGNTKKGRETPPDLDAIRTMGIQPDDRVAYMWYSLAANNGDDDALRLRGYVGEVMTKLEIAQAEQMTRAWKPGDCPSKEHRLGRPAET